jgi:hypothetical protein
MNKIIALLLITSQAFGAMPPTNIKGQTDSTAKVKTSFQVPHSQATDLGGVKSLIETGNGNILPDPGFEAAVSVWTSSGGATATTNATAKGTGALGYDWDSNGASQTLTSSSVTIPNGLQGKNGVISCNIKTVSGTATHTLGLWDGTTLSSTQTITSSTTSFAETKINMVFPASGTAAIRISAISSNESEIYIDDCKISLADNIGTVAQSILMGTITISGCANAWSTTASGSFTAFAAQTGCNYTTTGYALQPSTNVPAIKFASLPAGEYSLEYEGRWGQSSGFLAKLRFTDGTNTARENSQCMNNSAATWCNGIKQSISYSSPQSNTTLEIYGLLGGAGSTELYGITGSPATIKVYYFPSSSQQAVSSAQADYDWTSYTPTFTGFGTVTGVECQHQRVTSNLNLRCKFVTGTTTATEARISLPNGLISADTTKIPSIQYVGPMFRNLGTAANGLTVLIEPSVSYVTFGQFTNGGVPLTKVTGSAGFNSSETQNFTASIPIQGWSSNQRAPTLVGSVTSNASGALRTEYATLSNSCSVSNSSSSWITLSTGTDISAANCVYTMTGWSSAPICSYLQKDTNECASKGGVTTTSTSLGARVRACADNGAITSTGTDVICIGPR